MVGPVPGHSDRTGRHGGRIASCQVCDWTLPLPADALPGRGHVGDGCIDFRTLTDQVTVAGYTAALEGGHSGGQPLRYGSVQGTPADEDVHEFPVVRGHAAAEDSVELRFQQGASGVGGGPAAHAYDLVPKGVRQAADKYVARPLVTADDDGVGVGVGVPRPFVQPLAEPGGGAVPGRHRDPAMQPCKGSPERAG